MRYHNITQDDMNNGDGLRVVLWVAGCEHHCKGCQNPVTWNPDDGLVFDKRAFNEIMKALQVRKEQNYGKLCREMEKRAGREGAERSR